MTEEKPDESMSTVEAERQMLLDAKAKGPLATLSVWIRLSGPGWLQSAITLGGGSLASSLYLGVLVGFSMMWLQPLFMILGIVMLGAIGYVTMSTGKRPFRAINEDISPVLGWSWLLAALMANMVWALPQYSLCYGVLEQNIMPGTIAAMKTSGGFNYAPWVVSGVVLAFSTMVVWSYGSGHWGVKLYELMLKIVVGLIVLCFFGVVVQMSLQGGLTSADWGSVLAGFIPNPMQLINPAPRFQELLSAIDNEEARTYWTALIVKQQREVLISAAATAVGINMTFLLPYSMLQRKWGKAFRGLAIFDLSTGMFIPFVLATSCVVIAAASQFHARMPIEFKIEGDRFVPAEPIAADESASAEADGAVAVNYEKNEKEFGKKWGAYNALVNARNKTHNAEAFLPAPPKGEKLVFPAYDDAGRIDSTLSIAEKKVASAMIKRDAFDLAQALKPLTGETFANVIFGFGVVGMTLSTISLLMLISGFAICEILNLPTKGWPFRFGCMAAATGVLWPILWAGEARFWLAIVASNFGMVLLPIAYWTFFFMMNSEKLLGKERPRGASRITWNTLMLISAIAATLASVWVVWSKIGDVIGKLS